MDTANSNQPSILQANFNTNPTGTMRKSVWLFSIIVLGICVWIVLHRRNELMRGQLQSTVSNQPLENQSATSQSTQQNASPIINVSPAKIISQPTPDARSQQAIASWNTPIEFYGKVIDENSNPVAGATINFRWATQTEDVSATTATTESDLDGLFSLQGKRGRSLDVSVGKVGYYNSRRDKTGFLYALASDIYSPDRMNPVVFHLYKKGKGEALIEKDFPPGIGQIWQLRHDGTLIELDLLNGTQVSAGNGQLKLEFLRDISNMNVRPFDWKLQITAVGGGLVPTDEEFAFQ